MTEVIVVSGHPRSGTSLLMQMLGAAGVPLLVDSERAADEDNPRGYFEYAPVKRIARDGSWVGAAQGRAVKVVIPLLSKLPAGQDYRVILVQRAVEEVLASQARMLARVGAAEGPGDERLRALHERMFEDGQRWCRAHARSLLVDHAELLRAPVESCRAVADFLGLPPERASAMAACVDPELHRQRAQPSV